jgi:hypothetical protein
MSYNTGVAKHWSYNTGVTTMWSYNTGVTTMGVATLISPYNLLT